MALAILLDPALRDYILLIAILVAPLEATAQQLTPYQAPVGMGFSGVIRQEPARTWPGPLQTPARCAIA